MVRRVIFLWSHSAGDSIRKRMDLRSHSAGNPVRKSMVYRTLMILTLIMAVLSSLYTAYYAAGFARQTRIRTEMSRTYAQPDFPGMRSASIEEPPKSPEPDLWRFERFIDINPDFKGVLLIPGLELELPFVQYGDNSRYLHYDFSGHKSPYGTIFLDYRNAPDFSDRNTILYGHNMKDGTMFNKLSEYTGPSGIQNAPVIYIDSLSGQSAWLVFAAYVCRADCGYNDVCRSGGSFEALLDVISKHYGEADVNSGDTILTLSTCNYSFKNARLAVHARKLRAGEYIRSCSEQVY